jgi:hypothetical protein
MPAETTDLKPRPGAQPVEKASLGIGLAGGMEMFGDGTATWNRQALSDL